MLWSMTSKVRFLRSKKTKLFIHFNINYLVKNIKSSLLVKAKAIFSIANNTLTFVSNLKFFFVFKRNNKYNMLKIQIMVLMILLTNS